MNPILKPLWCGVVVAALFCPGAGFGGQKKSSKVQLAATNRIGAEAPRYPIAVLESKGASSADGAPGKATVDTASARTQLSGRVEQGGGALPKPPPCPSSPFCCEVISNVERVTPIRHPSNLGIVAEVKGDATLEDVAVEVYKGEKLVFRTEACEGCPVPLKTRKDGKADSRLFILDLEAVRAGSKFFLPTNEITVRGKIKSESAGSVTLSLVALKPMK